MGHSLPTPVLGQKVSPGPLCRPRPGTVPDRGDTWGQCAQLVGRVSLSNATRLGEQALAGTPGLTSQRVHSPHCTSEDYSHKLWGQPHQGQHNPTYFGPGLLMVLVSWGCYNKEPQTGWFKTTEIFSHSSESLKSQIKVSAPCPVWIPGPQKS